MKTPVALFITALLTVVGCNTVDLSELPAQEELRVAPLPQKAGGSDDSIRPAINKPVVIQKGGIPGNTINPVQRGGASDDSLQPVQKGTVPTPVRAPR